jgi:large subunit ribosomal protein L21
MFAVIKTGGKQYRVNKDEIISIERLQGDAGSKVVFDEVLMLGEDGKAPTIGAPLIAGAKVSAEVVEQTRSDKVTVIKFRRRQNYHRTKGHRQFQTLVKITDISAKAPKAAKKAAEEPAVETNEE